VIVEPAEPIVPMATLRDAHRPTMGGLQINFPGFLCTLGFNALDGTQESFITNSHCTANQGGVDDTPYYQPTQSISPTRLATEVEDPVFTASAGCPSGRVCRRSDAARARYDDPTGFQLGRIARTGSSKNGSLEVVGHWTIAADDGTTDQFPIGSVLNKVGRTTGWSQGKVSQTCVDYGVSGTNIVVFCQTAVRAKVNSGDSGAPVFAISGGTNATLVGILWGGGGGSFVFSPLKNVEAELGNLTVR